MKGQGLKLGTVGQALRPSSLGRGEVAWGKVSPASAGRWTRDGGLARPLARAERCAPLPAGAQGLLLGRGLVAGRAGPRRRRVILGGAVGGGDVGAGAVAVGKTVLILLVVVLLLGVTVP